MIKTMLVEDERILLEDLLTIIDWRTEGFDIVATAANGKQGLMKFEQFQPDLIISDIKMPVMDGLTMLKSIKHSNPNTRFFILSSYNEFEYAKDAIRLGAEDYILKTEISASYLIEKLSIIKERMTHEAALLIAVIEKQLLDFVSTPLNAAREKLDEILRPVTAYHLTTELSHFTSYLSSLIEKKYIDLKIPDKYNFPEIKTYAGLSDWLITELDLVTHYEDVILTKHYSPIIINAVEYIHKYYSNPNLKINTIAEHIGLSPGRLSVLFKKELNITINDYIIKLRIEEAKKLLSSGRYKVYEVAEAVGYKTSQYFSQTFFQITGQYPNQYRRGLDT